MASLGSSFHDETTPPNDQQARRTMFISFQHTTAYFENPAIEQICPARAFQCILGGMMLLQAIALAGMHTM
jgi:hypothetical protein